MFDNSLSNNIFRKLDSPKNMYQQCSSKNWHIESLNMQVQVFNFNWNLKQFGFCQLFCMSVLQHTQKCYNKGIRDFLVLYLLCFFRFSAIEAPEQCVKYVQSEQQRHQNDVSDLFVVSLALTLNLFHIFCQCFYG